jgi:hypothetical protein
MTLPDDPLLHSLGKLARARNDEVAQLELRGRDVHAARAPGGTRVSGTRPAADAEARAIAPFLPAEQARIADFVRRSVQPHRNGRTESRAVATASQPRSSKAGGPPALKVLRGDATPTSPTRVPNLRVAVAPAETTPANDVQPPPARAPASGRAQTKERSTVRLLRRAAAIVLPLSAAAALALFMQPRPNQVLAIPSYSLELQNTPAEFRSAEPGAIDPAKLEKPIELGAGRRLVLSLRPTTSVSEPIQTRVLVRQLQGVQRWPATVETSPHGAVRLQLERASTNATGPAELIVLIGHGESPPPSEAGSRGWQRWTMPLLLTN